MDVNAINQFLGQPSLLLMSNLISRCYNHRRAIGPPTAIPESASLVTNQLLFPIRVIKQLYRRGTVTNQELSCTTTERQSSPTFQSIEKDNSQQILRLHYHCITLVKNKILLCIRVMTRHYSEYHSEIKNIWMFCLSVFSITNQHIDIRESCCFSGLFRCFFCVFCDNIVYLRW